MLWNKNNIIKMRIYSKNIWTKTKKNIIKIKWPLRISFVFFFFIFCLRFLQSKNANEKKNWILNSISYLLQFWFKWHSAHTFGRYLWFISFMSSRNTIFNRTHWERTRVCVRLSAFNRYLLYALHQINHQLKN